MVYFIVPLFHNAWSWESSLLLDTWIKLPWDSKRTRLQCLYHILIMQYRGFDTTVIYYTQIIAASSNPGFSQAYTDCFIWHQFRSPGGWSGINSPFSSRVYLNPESKISNLSTGHTRLFKAHSRQYPWSSF